MEIFQTKRLLLRDFKEADWKAVHSYASDPEVVRYVDWGPNTVEETKSFIRRAIATQKEQPRRNYHFAIVLKTENRLIGACGIFVSNPDNREGWIGFVLNRHFWGQGYATEAAKALVIFGFKKLNLHRIFATCDPANIASARVLEKIGMQREGRLREHKWVKGKWRDSLLYALLNHEWKEQKLQNDSNIATTPSTQEN
jgi:RimJ/RimL family protein N-acetyltransferase